MTDNNDEKDEIDELIEEAAKKRRKRVPKNPNSEYTDNGNAGANKADYFPCPMGCGATILSIPGHLPCDDE